MSVVTPVYNGAAYLAECIESVRRQTYQQWDYVIVDNCSTDETGEIAEAYAARDPRIRVVHNSRLLPIMENWNLAMRQIAPESRYCKMVHADDWIYPECLERMVSLADRHPTVGIVASLRIRGERLMPDEPARDFEGEVLPGEDVCRMRLLTGKSLFGSPTSVMFRSDIVRSRDKFFNEDNIRADAEAGFDVLQDYDLGFVPEVLTHTRTHEDSVTSQNASLGTNMLGDYLLGRRFIPRFFDGEMADKLLRERTDTYYMYLATSLAFGRWKTWKYHRDGLDRLGLGFEARELARAFLNIARRAAGAPKVILKGLAHRAPMEQYLSELQGIAGYRRKTSVRWRSAEPTGDAAASAVDLVWEEPA